jgi:biotin transport system substrate-specific component
LNTELHQLYMTACASLLAALTAVGAFIAIPIGPVPIVLQNLFVYLTGLLLGSKWGSIGMAVYLLAGACGLPVFSGGKGGIGHLVGPTGGYLVGFLPAVYIIGWITERAEKKGLADILAMICATAVIYSCGLAWLKLITGMTLAKTLAVGMLPFLIGDAVKIAAAAALAKALRPIMKVKFSPDLG